MASAAYCQSEVASFVGRHVLVYCLQENKHCGVWGGVGSEHLQQNIFETCVRNLLIVNRVSRLRDVLAILMVQVALKQPKDYTCNARLCG